MNGSGRADAPPNRILLATDLSARCDRALDRAAALAAEWQAELVVLHALEDFAPDLAGRAAPLPSWRRPPDPASLARRELLADLGGLAERSRVVIDQGDPVEAILRTAAAQDCGLIVTGVARGELFGRFGLGRTVDRLLRRSPTPLLVVKNRARKPYDRITVATDFSESSRGALEAATRFFPGRRLTVFHAYDPPMAGLSGDAAAYRREYRALAVQECEAFVAGAKRPAGAPAPRLLVEYGDPAELLRDYAGARELDLAVLGTHGRSALFEAFLGSVAKRIIDEVPCDALVIREPRAAVEA